MIMYPEFCIVHQEFHSQEFMQGIVAILPLCDGSASKGFRKN